MPRRRRLCDDHKRRSEIDIAVGSSRADNWYRIPQDYLNFIRWQKRTHPRRDFAERVYAAMLFLGDVNVACLIAERSTTIDEAATEAKAMIALKEIANVPT